MEGYSMIVAMDENSGIGANNELLWHLPDDFKWFKKNTLGNPVIMGRKTMDSLPKVLPNRRNIVLGRDASKILNDFEHAATPQEALEMVREEKDKEVFIIGGSSIYELYLPQANRLYLTRVHTKIENVDAYFPAIKREEWDVVFREHHPMDDKHKYAFDFEILERATRL
jgi:dihydrofolate reductase